MRDYAKACKIAKDACDKLLEDKTGPDVYAACKDNPLINKEWVSLFCAIMNTWEVYNNK